jgi:hypothetical protein
MSSEDVDKIVRALDRLSSTLIISALVSRNDMKVESIDKEMFKKAIEENTYFKEKSK